MESSKLLDKGSSDNFEYVSNLFESTEPSSVGENRTPKCELEPVVDLPSESLPETSLGEPERSFRKGSVPKRSSARNVEEERGSDPIFKVELEPYSNSARDLYKTAAMYIKQESFNCVLCAGGTDATLDIYCETTCGDVTLYSYICKVGNLNLEHRSCSKYACRSCFELLNVIERSELEYKKHRGLLLEIISQNPTLVGLRADSLRARSPPFDRIGHMKSEPCHKERIVSSGDDEPLACMKASCINKSDTTEFCAEPKQLDDNRYFSSDDDFHWKLETEEGENTAKKTNTKGRKNLKEEKGLENSSEILMVEFEEQNTEEDSLAKNKANKTTKLRNWKNKRDPDPSNCEKISNELKCNKCNRIFKKRCYLERHSHCKKPYICEICGKGFKSPKLCQTHVLLHQGIADYKCIPCNKLFPTKVAFLRHDKIHNGVPNNQCDQCGKSFIHQSSLRMHKLAHAGVRKYTCDVCGLALLSNPMLTRHKLVHTGEKNFTCPVCFKKFARNSNMQTHMKTHTKDKPRPPTPPDVPGKRRKVFRCDMCPERFDRLFKLEIHLVDDHKVVLKKGRPKPRNTMKKLQRAQQAAATVVNAIATAMGAKRAGLISTDKMKANPGSNVNEKAKEGSSSDAPDFKMSPHHQSMSPTAAYMSPTPSTAYTQESSEPVRTDYQDHHQIIKTAGVMIPPMAFNIGAEYLSRIPDYSQQ